MNTQAAKSGPRHDDLMRLLLWEGQLQNRRIRQLYGLGAVRASQVIQAFRDDYPELLEWDSKRKAFLATAKAYATGKRPPNIATTLSLDGYTTLMSGIGEFGATLVGEDDAPLANAYRDLVTPRPQLFAFLRTCILEGGWASLTYRSMGRPEPHTRTVLPSKLVRAGRRWHLRAFAAEVAGYRDFNLGRIERWTETDEVDTPVPADEAWNRKVAIRLVPHPNLEAGQEEVVRLEFMGGTVSRVETCRGALVPYLLQDFRAATDVQRQRPPEYQLAVGNLDEVRPWLWT